MYKTFIFLTISLSTFIPTCKKQIKNGNERPLVAVSDQYLYAKQLPDNSNLKLSPDDSAKIIDNYIKNWVSDAIMYEHAKKNIKNPSEIDQLVNEYRKTITIQHYQQSLINERLPKPTEEEIRTFYDKHNEQFLLESNIIKGLFIKIPKNTKDIKKLYNWMNETEEDKLEKIEKFCVSNYASLDYFEDKWMLLDDLIKKLPLSDKEKNNFNKQSFIQNTFKKNSSEPIEFNDNIFLYLIDIKQIKYIGEEEPYDFARDNINNILLNQKKIEFIQQFKDDLYNHSKKEVVYFNDFEK